MRKVYKIYNIPIVGETEFFLVSKKELETALHMYYSQEGFQRDEKFIKFSTKICFKQKFMFSHRRELYDKIVSVIEKERSNKRVDKLLKKAIF